jgi:hypothetical protein
MEGTYPLAVEAPAWTTAIRERLSLDLLDRA